MTLGLVTCAVLPEPDHDERLLVGAFEQAGVGARMVAWDDPEADLGGLSGLVLRSCWNYHLYAKRFLEWLRDVSRVLPVLNPVDVVSWNADKMYLEELSRRGIPVVPTEFVVSGKSASPGEIARARGWDAVVIKPTVSAASHMTKVFEDPESDDALEHMREVCEHQCAMVQPFLSSVLTVGERSIIWVNGKVTHYVVKKPRLAGQDESVSSGFEPMQEDRVLADSILEPWRDRIAYARIDLFQDEDEKWALSELELIEPSLFFTQFPGALGPFVEGTVAKLRGLGVHA